MRAVILAGGEGRRLRPYTTVLPKPLMPVGDRPILEIVVEQVRDAGFDRITIAVGYLASLIQSYFGDGERFGVAIDYSLEPEPLGTAGPLGLIDGPTESFLVMNGDLLTDLDLKEFAKDHAGSGAEATLAVYEKQVAISLGVLDVDDHDAVTAYTEKPTLSYPVSSGMYMFEPTVVDRIALGQPMDLPDLIRAMIADGASVRAYRFGGTWLDIGRPEDYEEALSRFADDA